MKKIIIIFFCFFFIRLAEASLNKKIIINLEKINNLSFDFKQTINNKSEIGNCVIKYPKRIFCTYANLNEKIIVSNGISLVIKNKNLNQYLWYNYFIDYVEQNHINIYNNACEHADKIEKL